MAYKNSETNDGADLYYFNVTSMLSVMKTSVYLAETLASDLFIVRLSIAIQYSREYPSSVSTAVSVLYCLEREPRGHHSPGPSLYRRHWYAFPIHGVGFYLTIL